MRANPALTPSFASCPARAPGLPQGGMALRQQGTLPERPDGPLPAAKSPISPKRMKSVDTSRTRRVCTRASSPVVFSVYSSPFGIASHTYLLQSLFADLRKINPGNSQFSEPSPVYRSEPLYECLPGYSARHYRCPRRCGSAGPIGGFRPPPGGRGRKCGEARQVCRQRPCMNVHGRPWNAAGPRGKKIAGEGDSRQAECVIKNVEGKNRGEPA